MDAVTPSWWEAELAGWGWQPKHKVADNTHACFCFSAVEQASAFQCAFGGELITFERAKPKLKPW